MDSEGANAPLLFLSPSPSKGEGFSLKGIKGVRLINYLNVFFLIGAAVAFGLPG